MSRRGNQLHRERAKIAAKLRREGLTYSEIAGRLGVVGSGAVKHLVELGERLLSVEADTLNTLRRELIR